MSSKSKSGSFLLLAGLAILVILFSCKKPTDDQRITQTPELIYYNYYSDRSSFPQNNDSLDCRRICFDIANERVVWNKKNDRAPAAEFVQMTESTWSKAFDTGNDIVTIFPTADIPSAGQITSRANAIYFQKVNKSTGDQVVLKQVVSASEIGTSIYFTMSQVITNGTYFYFWLANGNVYCINSNGDLVWKKGAYGLTNTVAPNNYFGYTYLYCDNDKIYVTNKETTVGWRLMNCLNASTGQESWVNITVAEPVLKELMFTNNKILQFSKYAVGVLCDKATGNEISPFAVSNASGFYPLMVVDNNTLLFTGVESGVGNLGIITISPLRAFASQNIDFAINRDCKTVKSPAPRLYTVSTGWGNGKMTVASIDPNAVNMIEWKKTYQYTTGALPYYYVFDYYVKDSKLYLLTNFEIKNGLTVNNIDKTYSIIILDISSGNVVKQISNLPAGRAQWGAYNVLHE